MDTNSKGESVKPISPSISQDGGETREENEDSIIDKSKNTISDQGKAFNYLMPVITSLKLWIVCEPPNH